MGVGAFFIGKSKISSFFSCQVSLKSVQRFQKRSRKCISQSKAGWLPWISDRRKNTNLVEDVEILLPVKFC